MTRKVEAKGRRNELTGVRPKFRDGIVAMLRIHARKSAYGQDISETRGWERRL